MSSNSCSASIPRLVQGGLDLTERQGEETVIIRYSCDRSVIRGSPPAAQFEDLLGIDLELTKGGLDLIGTKV